MHRALLLLCCLPTLPLLAVSCGGKTSDAAPTTTDAGSTDTGLTDLDTGAPIDTGTASETSVPDAEPPHIGLHPPPRPSAVASGGVRKWFVIDHLYLGTQNRSTGSSSPNAWQDLGYDLDDRITTADDSKISNNSCHRRAGSPSGILRDGTGGIDNNWGAHVMQVVKALRSDAEDLANTNLADGKTTLLLVLDNVAGDDNAAVPGAIYVTSPLATPPRFDGSDRYPVLSTSLVDGTSIDRPLTSFPKGYMSAGVWVSGDRGTDAARIPVPFAGGSLDLPLESAIISMRVSDGTAGVVSGATRDTALEDAIKPWAEALGICPGNATYDQVVSTLTQSVDLVSGAPQLQNTSIECNALSIGLGFNAVAVQPSTSVVTPPTPPPSPCPPP